MSEDEPTEAMPRPERYADDARRYRLDDRIATGGMGEVWRGTDTVLGRTVAIKLLKHEYADDATFRTRFESEAQHAGSLNHPGIAGVFDVGEGHGEGAPRPFLVMEHVRGQPLSALLRPGAPMDPDAARDLLAQAAAALGAAHARGIVHRDVKPANLLVTPDRTVKVTDFGIARAADAVALTETGQVLGTPLYLSPEQARGETATAASDVYALGVVAYQCLVGYPPFRGESSVATALAHLRDPVPELPRELPEDLAGVVRRALAKDPADRFTDGSAFAAALRDPGSVSSDPATAVLPSAGAGRGAAAAGLGAGAAGAAGAAAGAAGAAAAGRRYDDGDAGPVTSRITGPIDEPVPPPDAPPGDRDQRRGLPPWLPWVLLLLVVAALAWVAFRLTAGADDAPEDTPTPTSTATATVTETPTPTETTPTESDTPTPEETTATAEATPTAEDTPTETPTDTGSAEATPTDTGGAGGAGGGGTG